MAASPRESVLNDSQIASLSIEKLMLHVIDVEKEGDERVIALDEIILNDEQKLFFLERIKSVAKGIQYEFNTASTTKSLCFSLLRNDENFTSVALALTNSFASQHRKRMSSGVFVTTIVQTVINDEPVQLVFLAKLDHRTVYKVTVQAREDGQGTQAIMEKVLNTLVEDKSAIQKSALIDVSDNFTWSVLADERQLKASGEISDYFKGFLQVSLMEVASVLTRKAVSTVGDWAKSLQATDMPDGEEKGNYKARAVAYMATAAQFKISDFIDAVVRDDDDDRKTRVKSALKAKLETVNITNQEFTPKPNSLPKKAKVQTWITAEKVKLEFEGESSDVGLRVQQTDGGDCIITIQTSSVVKN